MSGQSGRNLLPTTNCDPFVIAEVGVNHDGDPERALQLVEAAARAGADAVKVQWFRASRLLSRSARLAAYQRDTGETDVQEMLGRLELDAVAMERILERAHECGLAAIATVFSTELVAEATAMNWDFFKTASGDLINRPLLEALGSDGRPLIISTGGSSLEEVRDAIGWIGDVPLGLLHCVSSYPTPSEHAALAGIDVLAGKYGLPVGYSDHTCGWETGGLAVAAGATMLEKHLTWDVSASGPDHASSLDPGSFERYVAFARDARRMLGESLKEVLSIEETVREHARQSVAAGRDLRAGVRLTAEDLTTMRPGSGFSPALIPELLGRRLARDVDRGVLIQQDDLCPSEVCS